jgi:transcriptional regulator with XRE-family HTH domain
MKGADLIREARRRAGISQSELSRRTGIPQAAISVYESGKREPGLDTSLRLLLACGEIVELPRRLGSVDRHRCAEHLSQALSLAEALPRRRRPPTLEFPVLARLR